MLKKLKVVSAVLAAAMLFGNSAYAAELSAEAIWDGSYLTVKGKLEQGNNNEFGIIITTPEEKISVYQNTGESDGSFEFKYYIPPEEVAGEYKVLIDTQKADNPVSLSFVKEGGAEAAFSDIGEAAWAGEAIRFMKDRGYAKGDGDGRFRPNDSVSCSELIKLALSAVGGVVLEENAADWSAVWIAAANERGFIDKIFAGCDLSAPAQRQQAAAIIYELSEKAEATEKSGFSDSEQIADFAKEAVNALSGKIISGFPDGSFQPEGTLTRAQVAQMLYKMEREK